MKKREREIEKRERWRSARESDYVRARRGTEIRCCVKYNTYFTTEIPIPSTRTEIHRGAIKFNELPAGNFLWPKRHPFWTTQCTGGVHTFMGESSKTISPELSLGIIDFPHYNQCNFELFENIDISNVHISKLYLTIILSTRLTRLTRLINEPERRRNGARFNVSPQSNSIEFIVETNQDAARKIHPGWRVRHRHSRGNSQQQQEVSYSSPVGRCHESSTRP